MHLLLQENATKRSTVPQYQCKHATCHRVGSGVWLCLTQLPGWPTATTVMLTTMMQLWRGWFLRVKTILSGVVRVLQCINGYCCKLVSSHAMR